MTDNRRIAKNTLMLYIRALVVILVGMYTSRVVLRELGETDFGIYNVVGGVVVLFSFVNSAISSAVLRFINFELGKKEDSDVNGVFCVSMSVMAVISIIFLLLAESAGLWFLETQLNIPSERMGAARWVYQFSIISCIITIFRSPYNALIVAHERMSFYAKLSILESLMKLLIAFFLIADNADRLIHYSALVVGINIVLFLSYKLFCARTFIGETSLRLVKDKSLYVQLFSYSGWTVLGSTADVCCRQGINMLINIFNSVVVNAAAGVSTQLSNMVYNLVQNFQTAFRPQIVKNYAAGEMNDFRTLIFRSSKFSFFLLFFLSYPVILNMDFILGVWLKDVPELSASFAFWIFLYMMIDALSAPLWMGVQAIGKIRNYQIMLSIIALMNIPAAWALLKADFPVVCVFIVKFIINIILHIYRIVYLDIQNKIPAGAYNRAVTARVLAFCLIAVPLPLLVAWWQPQGILRFLSTGFSSVIMTFAAVYAVGLTSGERKEVIDLIKNAHELG